MQPTIRSRRHRQAFRLGLRDAFEQVKLYSGIVWDDDEATTKAYEIGTRVGEFFARLTFWRKPEF